VSTALATAIYARLAGTDGASVELQEDLAALLATDPDTELPAVVYGSRQNAAVSPCITFRQMGGGEALITDGGRIDSVTIPIEIWGGETLSATLVSDIYSLLERLLDRNMGAPALELDSGRLFWLEAQTLYQDYYDDARNAPFGLALFRAIEARAA
jgi:hypothetical protein